MKSEIKKLSLVTRNRYNLYNFFEAKFEFRPD